MSSSKKTQQQQFEQWLDQTGERVSPDSEREQQWLADPELAKQYETALWLKHQAQCLPEQPVPEWDRLSGMKANGVQQNNSGIKVLANWLDAFFSPKVSMAFSLTAICMVLFGVQVEVGEQGVLISFAGQSNQQIQQKIDQQVDEKLKQFSQDQQTILATYLTDLDGQQKQQMAQLASYLLKANREERKEELSELITFMNAQRQDDLQLTRQQFQQALYQVSSSASRPTHATEQIYTPTLYRQRNESSEPKSSNNQTNTQEQ